MSIYEPFTKKKGPKQITEIKEGLENIEMHGRTL